MSSALIPRRQLWLMNGWQGGLLAYSCRLPATLPTPDTLSHINTRAHINLHLSYVTAAVLIFILNSIPAMEKCATAVLARGGGGVYLVWKRVQVNRLQTNEAGEWEGRGGGGCCQMSDLNLDISDPYASCLSFILSIKPLKPINN